MPKWGVGKWGVGPWGVGSLEVLFAEPIAENRVRVHFSEDADLSGLLTLDDGMRFQNYTVAAVSGARAVSVVNVERVIGSDGRQVGDQVDLILDRPMSRFPARYLVTVQNVDAVSGSPIDVTSNSAEFDGLLDKRVPPLPETAPGKRDIANPQTLADTLDPIPDVGLATLGSIPVDDTGDYAWDEGLAYLRKRIFRRIVVRKGGFYHLPDYGMGLTLLLKQNVSTSLLRQIQEDAEQQLRQEPDVEELSVTAATQQSGGATLLRVDIRVRAAGRQAQFAFPFKLSEGTT